MEAELEADIERQRRHEEDRLENILEEMLADPLVGWWENYQGTGVSNELLEHL